MIPGIRTGGDGPCSCGCQVAAYKPLSTLPGHIAGMMLIDDEHVWGAKYHLTSGDVPLAYSEDQAIRARWAIAVAIKVAEMDATE